MEAAMVHAALLTLMLATTSATDGPAIQQEPRGVIQQVFETTGEVDDVDRVGRMITIKSAGVVQTAIYAGPDLPIFDQLSRGDIVTIRYYDAYIVAVTPGARMGPPSNTTAEAQQSLDRDNAGVMQQTKLTVTIDAIDASSGVVTYHGFDNRRVQRQVQQRALLEGVKVGDVVTITYTRARAAAITKGQ
jgi:Cu/Ag efflux protein CusF